MHSISTAPLIKAGASHANEFPYFFQNDEITSSTQMEKEGLIRGLSFLTEQNVSIASLTTDRHPGIKKYMRLHQGGIMHYFDVWHVAKGMKRVCMASF